jgi:hypothetical protein
MMHQLATQICTVVLNIALLFKAPAQANITRYRATPKKMETSTVAVQPEICGTSLSTLLEFQGQL